jgi:hypothetical protein
MWVRMQSKCNRKRRQALFGCGVMRSLSTFHRQDRFSASAFL